MRSLSGIQAPFGDLIGAQELLRNKPTYERRAALPAFDWNFSQADSEGLSERLAEALSGDGLSKPVMVEVNGLEPSASTLRKCGSQRFDQGLSYDLPGSGVSIPSGSLTIPLLPAR